jgi:hypothetical protein
MTHEIKIGSAVFSFGDPCPPIESIFFPWDEKDKSVKEEREVVKDDSSQSA